MTKIIGLVQGKSRAAFLQPALGKIDPSQSSIDVNLKNLFFINIQAMISNNPFKLKYFNAVPQRGLHPLLNEI